MSFKTLTCVVIECDGCDTPWDADEGIPHFDDKDQAIDYVTDRNWLIAGDRALCERCAAEETCALTGHDWGAWQGNERDGIAYRRRSCDRCCDSEYDPPFEVLYPKFQALRDAEDIVRGAGRAGDAA